jgi:hypothetical protein
MINTREGLIDALTEASELEHGLMLQYLFAALSLKKRSDEGITPSQQEQIRSWEGAILGVARDEMGHLGTVCNLLSSIGASPRLGRPNFPQPAHTYYPFDFELARFSDEALYRFIRAELPKGEPLPDPPRQDATRSEALAFTLAPPVPDPLEYDYVGELYRQIEEAFFKLPENELFIGPKSDQDTDDWSRGMKLHKVVDRATAKKAIDSIVLEGEGAPANRTNSHYNTFLTIRKALQSEGNIEPARLVARNPRTRPHRDSPYPVTPVKNKDAVALMELLNAIYATVLLMLMQFYSFGGESPDERSILQSSIRQTMSLSIRPISEILTEIPIDDHSGLTAAPSFEIYADLRLSTQQDNRWVILLERIDNIVGDAKELAKQHSRLDFVQENLGWIATNIRSALAAKGTR